MCVWCVWCVCVVCVCVCVFFRQKVFCNSLVLCGHEVAHFNSFQIRSALAKVIFGFIFHSCSLGLLTLCFCLSLYSETCTVSLSLKDLMASEKHAQFTCRTQGLEYHLSIALYTVLLPQERCK